jgi:NAD(P)-dependent dehydrogenase (short-subunit alcohol dehydrogenase family)
VALLARTVDELEATHELVESEGAEALVLPVDLRDTAALYDALEQTERKLGPITALVNNAAVLDLLSFEETTPDIWERAVDVNLHAAYHATRYVYPKMIERGSGSIHNVSSAAGWKGFADETAYCATKFGLEGFSKALALEATPRGVIVTLSSPGVRTKPTSVTMEDLQELPEEERQQWTDPVEMGEAFAYLAYARDPELAGLRFNLYRLSELVRQTGGLELDLDAALECGR